MFTARPWRLLAPRSVPVTIALVLLQVAPLSAQQLESAQIVHKVVGPSDRLEMTVNGSRMLTLDQKIPRAQVNNREILDLTPLSPTEVQVFAKKAGVTQINLWNEEGEVHTIDVVVFGDARELTMLLQSQFPHSNIKVTPLANSVVLSGFIERSDQVPQIIRIAEDYYPKVVNNLEVGGVQQVLLHCKLMEVSRTRLRAIGMDFATSNGADFLVSSVGGLINSVANNAQTVTAAADTTLSFGLVDGDDTFFGFLELVRQHNLGEVLSDPTLVAISGRPAYFLAGGEFPVLVPQSLGTVTITFKEFGTRLDMVPLVLGNGNIRLEVRPQVSELDDTRSVTVAGVQVPALRTREVETAVEMRAGQTLALAGLVQKRTVAVTTGVPFLADLPYFGVPFRRNRETTEEIELLVLVTPELVEPLEAHEVPPCPPGSSSESPNEFDFYLRGHIEVPSCGPCGPGGNCGPNGDCGHGGDPTIHEHMPAGEGQPLEIRSEPSLEEIPPSPDLGARSTKTKTRQATYGRGSVSEIRKPARSSRQTAPTAPVAPMSGSTKTRQLPYNPPKQSDSRPVNGKAAMATDQGLIGPIGYDVLK